MSRIRRLVAGGTAAVLALAALLAGAAPASAAATTTGQVAVNNVTGADSVPTSALGSTDKPAKFLVSYTCTAVLAEDKTSTCSDIVVSIPDIAQFPAESLSTPASIAAKLVQDADGGWSITPSTANGNLSLTVTHPGAVVVGTSAAFQIDLTANALTPNGTVLSLLPTIDADGWDAPVVAPAPAAVTVTGEPTGRMAVTPGTKSADGTTTTVPFGVSVEYEATQLMSAVSTGEAVNLSAGIQVVVRIPDGATLANPGDYPNAVYDTAANTLTFQVAPSDIHSVNMWSAPTNLLLQVPQTSVTTPSYTLEVTSKATSISGRDVTLTASRSFNGMFVSTVFLDATKTGRGAVAGDYNTAGSWGRNEDTVNLPPAAGATTDPWSRGTFLVGPKWRSNVATGYRVHVSDRFPLMEQVADDDESTYAGSGTAGTGAVYSSPSGAGTSVPAFDLTSIALYEADASSVQLLLDDGTTAAMTGTAVPQNLVGHVVGIELDLVVTSTSTQSTFNVLYLNGVANTEVIRAGDDHARLENTATVTWYDPDGAQVYTNSATGNLLVQVVAHPVTGYAYAAPAIVSPTSSGAASNVANKLTSSTITLRGSHSVDYGDTTMLTAVVVPDAAALELTSSTRQVTAKPLAGTGHTAYTALASPAGASVTSPASPTAVNATFSLADTPLGNYTYQFWTVQPDNTVPVTSCATDGGTLAADVYDLDGDGNTSELACMVTATFSMTSGLNTPAFQVSKAAQDQTGTWIDAPGIADIGSAVAYTQKLTFLNIGGQVLTDAVMYDVLPFPGDVNTVTGTARNSQFQPLFAGIVSLPDGVTAYYSTSATPCMPEENQDAPGTPQDGCTDDWSATAPADLGTVRALKFVKSGSLAVSDSFEVFIAERLPATDGSLYSKRISNSVAGGASYVGAQLLPAESDTSGVVSKLAPPIAAADDAYTTPYNTAKRIGTDYLVNDEAAGLAEVVLDQATKTGRGEWTIDPDSHEISFAPSTGFTGDATIDYTVKDANDLTSTATITVTVGKPGIGTRDDDYTTPFDTPKTIGTDYLDNDTIQAGVDTVALAKGTKGTWTVDAVTHEVTFTPTLGFSGVATAEYTVTDSAAQTSTSVITVTVGAPDIDTIADTYTTGFNTRLPIGTDYLGNDTIQGDLAGVEDVTLADGTHGTWTVDPTTHEVAFVPDDGFSGVARAKYTVADRYGQTSTTTITVTVGKPDAASTDDRYTTGFEAPLPIGTDYLGNDTIEGGLDGVTDVTLENGTHGTWAVDPATHEVTFTPAEGFAGEATVDYTVTDRYDQQTTSTITVTVGKPNIDTDDDAYSTEFGTKLSIGTDYLGNDTVQGGPDGVSTVTLENGTHGSWKVDPDTHELVFTPEGGFAGTATVDYTVSDEYGQSSTSTVSVTVGPPAIGSKDDAYTGSFGKPLRIGTKYLGNDTIEGGARGVTEVTLADGTHGTWTVDPDTHEVVFTPEAGFTGTASVTYTVTDRYGQTTTSTITVTVPAPKLGAKDDVYETPHNTPITIGADYLDNDAIEGGVKDVTLSGGTHGTWSIDPDTHEITFTPDPGFSGTATVTYTITDAAGNTITATITVIVGAEGMLVATGGVAQTGWLSTPLPWTGLLLVALVALAGWLVMVRRRRNVDGREQ